MVPNLLIPRIVASVWGMLSLAAGCIAGQQTGADAHTSQINGSQGVYVVFPFENAGASARLDWLGEGLEELTIQYLSAAGQQVYTHAGRTTELERNGLPFSAKLSRASMLRLAQDLDADFVIFGSFSSGGKSLTVNARVLRLDPTALLPAVRETASLDSLMELQSKVVWKLIASNSRGYRLTLAEFSKAQRPLRLDAFEHYIRGLLANEDQARLRELREASRLEPNWPDPDFALGETYFSRNDCNSALSWFARVPASYDRYAEAVFTTGVCRLQMNQPAQAEEVFTLLQTALGSDGKAEAQGGVTGAELPELLNNLAVARARQGKTSTAETDLRRATDLDPDEDDYPFNLGLLALRGNNFAAAVAYFREASDRRPENPEDRAFLIQALEKAGKKNEADEERVAANEALGPNALSGVRIDSKNDATSHNERVKTELDTATLRLQIESTGSRTNTVAVEGTADTPASHIRRGRQELTAGHLDNAEKEFQSALRADSGSAAAHRGLAEIYRHRGKQEDAIKELQASLASRDSAVVRTTLARLYLEQKKPDLARAEVQRALKLAPNYTEAKELLVHLQNVKPNGGAL